MHWEYFRITLNNNINMKVFLSLDEISTLSNVLSMRYNSLRAQIKDCSPDEFDTLFKELDEVLHLHSKISCFL